MKDILTVQLLAVVDAIDHEVETIKDARKAIRSKQTTVNKAIKMNEELGLDVTEIKACTEGLSQQLEDTAKEIRDYKLVRYRMMSAINILEGNHEETPEEVSPSESEE